MSAAIDQARMWMEQNRADRAEPELRRALQEDPQNPDIHAWLSYCLSMLDRDEEAEQAGQAAVRADPEHWFAHYVLAVARTQRGKVNQARASIADVLRLNPNAVDGWVLRGQVDLIDRKWDRAVEAAEHALQLDPESIPAANVRARALTQSGRAPAAMEELSGALARDPEDADTHANVGWHQLQQGKHTEAREHFREALRLEPGHEMARGGLLESIKARNPLYRAMLSFYMWMSRLPRRTVWIVIAAIFFLPRVLRGVARASPELEPIVFPLIVALMIFVYLTWTIEPLFDAALFLHPVGRYALTRDERRRATLVTLCVGSALGLGLAGALIERASGLMLVALVLLLFVIPLSGMLAVEGRYRKLALVILFGIGALAATIILVTILGLFTGNEPLRLAAAALFVPYIGVVVLASVAVNVWLMSTRTG